MNPLPALALLLSMSLAQLSTNVDWPRVGNDPGASRYSPLDQINRDNVATLTTAWTYHTGELEEGARLAPMGGRTS